MYIPPNKVQNLLEYQTTILIHLYIRKWVVISYTPESLVSTPEYQQSCGFVNKYMKYINSETYLIRSPK